MSHPGVVTNRVRITITYVPMYMHCWLALKHGWRTLAGAFCSVFGVLWMFFGAVTGLLGISYTGLSVFGSLAGMSLAVAAVYTGYRHSTSVPPGFEGELSSIQSVVRWKRPKWEYGLALLLLQDRLSRTDRQLRDLVQGRRYVGLTMPHDVDSYVAWLRLRPQNLTRMVEAAKQLLVYDLPRVLDSSSSGEGSPISIAECVDAISDLYVETLNFELESHRVLPPEGFDGVHRIQNGWSEAIRDGIRQVTDFLERGIARDLRSDEPLEFMIEFDRPKDVDEFNKELDRLMAQLPSHLP